MFSRLTIFSISRTSTSGRVGSDLAVMFDAPIRALAASGRYPRVGHGASQPRRLRLLSSSKGQASVRLFMFGPSSVGHADYYGLC